MEKSAESLGTYDDLIEQLDHDKGVTLTFKQSWETAAKMIKHLDDAQAKLFEKIRESRGRPEDLFTRESQIDKLTWESDLDEGGALVIQALSDKGGSPVGDPYTVRRATLSHSVGGIFWPDQDKKHLVFLTPEGQALRIDLLRGVQNEGEWRRVVIALVSRNHRLRAPIYYHPCPECGTLFKPERRGTIYDKRACADRAGQRRRYQEKKAEDLSSGVEK